METPDILIVVGRILLGGLFVAGGIKHFMSIPTYAEIMGAKGVSYPKEVLLIGSAWQTVFGLAFVMGIGMLVSSLALILFTIIATYIFMPFWKMEKGQERDMTFNCFMTNVAIIGGLLIAAAI